MASLVPSTMADAVRVERRRRLTFGAVATVAVVAGTFLVTKYGHDFPLDGGALRAGSSQVFPGSVLDRFETMVLTPGFVVVIALTLGLERLVPARKGQAILSVSFAHDLVWFFYEAVLHAIVIVTYVQLVTAVYQAHLQFLTISTVLGWPPLVRFALGTLALDFLYWGQHVTNHHVAAMWRLHTVHHSQRELNFFTDFRYHPLEYVVRHTWLVLPFLTLRVDPPRIAAFAIFATYYTRFYHGNIRTNLGPLRYILVTPQSHRIHHSIEPRHHGTNFGSLFSIWDQLFGTQYRGYDEYPDTGLDDEAFPHERSVGTRSLLLGPLVQMAYPFRTRPRIRA